VRISAVLVACARGCLSAFLAFMCLPLADTIGRNEYSITYLTAASKHGPVELLLWLCVTVNRSSQSDFGCCGLLL
jgi:hypothetical protein